MFSFFNRNKHKKRYNPEHSPVKNEETGEPGEEEYNDKDDLVRIDTLASLTQELQTAQNQIKTILEQKKHLETLLLEKEKYSLSLIEKISNLTIAFSQEKEALAQEILEHNKTKVLLEKEKNSSGEQTVAFRHESDSPIYIRNDMRFFSPKDMSRQNDFIYPVDVGFKY